MVQNPTVEIWYRLFLLLRVFAQLPCWFCGWKLSGYM